MGIVWRMHMYMSRLNYLAVISPPLRALPRHRKEREVAFPTLPATSIISLHRPLILRLSSKRLNNRVLFSSDTKLFQMSLDEKIKKKESKQCDFYSAKTSKIWKAWFRFKLVDAPLSNSSSMNKIVNFDDKHIVMHEVIILNWCI